MKQPPIGITIRSTSNTQPRTVGRGRRARMEALQYSPAKNIVSGQRSAYYPSISSEA